MTNTYKPQWGRSFLTKTPFPASQQQLVRVQFPEARDVTLYMQGLRSDDASLPEVRAVEYSVSAGIGGISIYEARISCPAVGTVQHWVCDALSVDVVVPAVSGVAGKSWRVSACAGPGSPNVTTEIGGTVATIGGTPMPPMNARPTNSNYGGAGLFTGESAWFVVPAWAYEAKIECAGYAALDPTLLTVSEVRTSGTPVHTSILGDYLQWHSLHPQTWWIHVMNAGAFASVAVTFHKET